ncbi:MAG TPA: Hsp20/alpha crystallin family protein, partial [Burkholderiaceae bacterium]|nr:Hsp20/alpha crystallin family protein [Burkholderiaceae bacterium]
KVQIEGKRLSIEATARVEREINDGEALLHSERFATHYARSFALPVDLDPAGASAKYENGLLTLTLPKKDAPKPLQINIQ